MIGVKQLGIVGRIEPAFGFMPWLLIPAAVTLGSLGCGLEFFPFGGDDISLGSSQREINHIGSADLFTDAGQEVTVSFSVKGWDDRFDAETRMIDLTLAASPAELDLVFKAEFNGVAISVSETPDGDFILSHTYEIGAVGTNDLSLYISLQGGEPKLVFRESL